MTSAVQFFVGTNKIPCRGFVFSLVAQSSYINSLFKQHHKEKTSFKDVQLFADVNFDSPLKQNAFRHVWKLFHGQSRSLFSQKASKDLTIEEWSERFQTVLFLKEITEMFQCRSRCQGASIWFNCLISLVSYFHQHFASSEVKEEVISKLQGFAETLPKKIRANSMCLEIDVSMARWVKRLKDLCFEEACEEKAQITRFKGKGQRFCHFHCNHKKIMINNRREWALRLNRFRDGLVETFLLLLDDEQRLISGMKINWNASTERFEIRFVPLTEKQTQEIVLKQEKYIFGLTELNEEHKQSILKLGFPVDFLASC